MKKKIIICVYSILLLIFINLLFRFIYNKIFISKYEEENYTISNVDGLLFANFFEPYIAHYNKGNLYYMNKDYTNAIYEYKKSLKLFPSESNECKIRINLALAMLKNISDNYDSEENIDNTLVVLKNAKQVLYEGGCANENDDKGHSKTAEKLKSEIEQIEKELELKKKYNESQSTESEEENGDENNNDDENRESEIKEELKERQYNSYQNRIDEQSRRSNYNSTYTNKGW